jgi:hypothetical protein
MRKIACKLFVVVICLFLGTSFFPAAAQTTTGDINGDVTDGSGGAVANVSVTVENTDTGVTRTTTTSGTGSYTFTQLAIGNYKITVSAEGFKTTISNATVATGATTRADIVMQLGQRNETVMVEASVPLMDLTPNENNFVDNLQIENVPLNGRDFNSLLAITPGVQRAPGGGFLAVSINGSRTTSNNYFVDGLYNNDRYYGDSAINQTGVVGIPATIFPPEAIQELSVQENPSAEFGVKGGAPIILGMKSGTNDVHGWAQWIRHTDFADAANFFSKANGCDQPGSCAPTPLRNMQFGGGVGGPIIKDRTFFFLFYEGQRYRSLSITSRTVPSPEDIAGAEADIAATGQTINPVGQALLGFFPTAPNEALVASTPTTARMDEFAFKIDHRINAHNTIAGRYVFGDSLQSGPPFAGLPAGGNNKSDLFNSIAPSRAQLAGLSWTWSISNNRILESRLGFTRFAQIIDINNKIDPKSLGMDTGPLSPVDFGVPYVYLAPLGYGGYIGGVQGYPITTRPDQTWDWSEHFSWVKGNHTIKLGGNYQTAYTNSLRNRARTGLFLGYVQFSNNPIQDAVEELLLGRADGASRSFGDTKRYLTQKSVGFYAQDEWKIRPNFTLTYGLRYEINGALSEKQNRAANFFPDRGLVQVGQGIDRLYNLDKGDFGPRIGFAWNIFKNGKTNLRGGYSLSYDVANFGAIAAPYTFSGARAGAFTQPNLGSFSVNFSSDEGTNPNDPAATCFDPVTQVGDYICFGNGLPIFGSSPTGAPPFNAFSIANNFKTPRAHNFNLGIQQEVFTNNVLSLTYSGQRGQNLLIDRDLNASPLGSGCTGSSCDALRPFAATFPDLRHIIQITNLASSQYDSLQASYNQRNWHGIDTQYNLTWSKCYDDNSVNRGGAGDYPQLLNPLNIADTRGLCDHDVRLNFNIGGVYAIPTIPHMESHIAKGWKFSTIFTAISGRPFSVLVGGGTDTSGQGLSGSAIRAAWDGTPVHYNTRNPNQYFDETFTTAGQADPCGNTDGDLPLSPFYIPCDGTVGNSRRNQLIGPGLAQWDASVIKDTKITERLTMQFRWEVYNLLNRANFFYLPNNTLKGGGLGSITKTPDVAVGNPVVAQGGPRNMNFALKFIF